jgi:hypothetical protein
MGTYSGVTQLPRSVVVQITICAIVVLAMGHKGGDFVVENGQFLENYAISRGHSNAGVLIPQILGVPTIRFGRLYSS